MCLPETILFCFELGIDATHSKPANISDIEYNAAWPIWPFVLDTMLVKVCALRESQSAVSLQSLINFTEANLLLFYLTSSKVPYRPL